MHLIPRQVGRCVEAIFEPVCPHFSWTGKTSVSKALRENQLGTAVITKGPCLSLFSSSPFQAEFPGAGVTGWRDGPDPLAVQVQCPDTHPCPAWWGWGWAAWVPLPAASFRVTQEEMLRAGFRGFFFFWWKHSNPVGAVHMVTESPGSQALFWKSELVVVFG